MDNFPCYIAIDVFAAAYEEMAFILISFHLVARKPIKQFY